MVLDGKQLIEQYEIQDAVPVLTEAEQVVAREYLASQAMEAVFGSINLNGDESPSKKLLLSHEPGSERYLNLPGAVVGPYFLDEDYYPSGLSIWAPVPEERR